MIDCLNKYQAWRRGEDERTMDEAGLDPATIGEAIDWAIDRIAELERERDEFASGLLDFKSAMTRLKCSGKCLYRLDSKLSAAYLGSPSASLARRDLLVAADALEEAAAELGANNAMSVTEDRPNPWAVFLTGKASRLRREAEGRT